MGQEKQTEEATGAEGATAKGGPSAATGSALTAYERGVLDSARKNHIWLNAFQCIRPTDEFKRQVGETILDMLDCRENLICDWQDSESEPLRAIGRLTPELIVRINKS